MSDFLHILFSTFSSLLGGMGTGASIVLFKEQNSFSCVFTTTYSFIFIRRKDWEKVADSHDMAEHG